MTSKLKIRFFRGARFFLILSGMIFTRNAFAYLDPGSGSFFIQMLIAALVAIPITFTGWLRRLRNLFKKKPPQKP